VRFFFKCNQVITRTEFEQILLKNFELQDIIISDNIDGNIPNSGYGFGYQKDYNKKICNKFELNNLSIVFD
ncbi:Hypothetical protein KVN_LOCUS255, partial [uncultured virus]